jgi:hypothetical protein
MHPRHMIKHLVLPWERLPISSLAPLTSLNGAPELRLPPRCGVLADVVAPELRKTTESPVEATRLVTLVLLLTGLSVAEDHADDDMLCVTSSRTIRWDIVGRAIRSRERVARVEGIGVSACRAVVGLGCAGLCDTVGRCAFEKCIM